MYINPGKIATLFDCYPDPMLSEVYIYITHVQDTSYIPFRCIISVTYEVTSTITFPVSRVSGFAGKSRRKKTQQGTDKGSKRTGVQYNFWVQTGIGVNFVLSFLLLSIYANSHLLPLLIAADRCCCCRGLTLTYYIRHAGRETIASTSIPRLIHCTG